MGIPEKHKYYFEVYYHLGQNRSIARLTRLQMPRLFPDLPADSEEYKRKFNSLYMKLRRWKETEEWDKEVEIREADKKQKLSSAVRSEEETLTDTVNLYRRMVRYLLQKFAESVANDSVQIKSLHEAQKMIELDMYLTQILDRRPKMLPTKVLELMTEDERRQSDKIFEWLRKNVTAEDAIRDLGDIIEAEAVVEEVNRIRQSLPPAPVEAEQVNPLDIDREPKEIQDAKEILTTAYDEKIKDIDDQADLDLETVKSLSAVDDNDEGFEE